MQVMRSAPTDFVAGSSSRLARWWHSKLGWRFGAELARMLGLFAIYKLVRLLAADEVGVAFDNARSVVEVEQFIGLFSEPTLQRWVLDNATTVRFLNGYYFIAHFAVTFAVFFFLYVARPQLYVVCRRVLIAMTAIGAFLHVLYPLAPPRMLPSLGFVDTGHLFGPSPYGADTSAGLANQFAAMPSLHFGWSVLIAWALIIGLRSRWRYLAVVHPFLTLAAIILTANHYWLDAIVALVVFSVLVSVHSSLRRRRSLTGGYESFETVPASRASTGTPSAVS